MLFTEGTRVRFKHTGDVGVITKILSEEMVNVLLDDDMEIPTFLENLEREDRTPPPHQPKIKAKFVAGKKEKQPPTPPKLEADSQYHILKSMGIQLAFQPKLRPDGTTSKYQIFLLNDTRYDVLFAFTLLLNDVVKIKSNGKIGHVTTFHLGEMWFDELNDAPIAEVECWQVTTEGTGKKLHKTLKIKAKQFFKNFKTAPLLDEQVHLFLIFENFNSEKKATHEDLKTYTQRNARKPKRQSSNYRRIDIAQPDEFANFENEIDLHIEKLVGSSKKMNNSEIVRIQLSHFESYIAKAIQLGVRSVFVIHGVGKGKLRSAIATSLVNNPNVKTFKNEFHPKYGWGATEVIF